MRGRRGAAFRFAPGGDNLDNLKDGAIQSVALHDIQRDARIDAEGACDGVESARFLRVCGDHGGDPGAAHEIGPGIKKIPRWGGHRDDHQAVSAQPVRRIASPKRDPVGVECGVVIRNAD